MIDQEKVSKWTHDHFVIYLYLCIAKANYDISDKELDVIKEKIHHTLGIQKYNTPLINHVKKEMEEHSDYEKFQYIEKNLSRFIPDQEKEKISKDLEDIVHADYDRDEGIESSEQAMLMFLKKIIHGF